MKDWHDHPFDEVFRRLSLKAHQVPKTKYRASGKYPIIDQGKEFIAGYTDEGTPVTNLPVIVFGDHTRVVKWVALSFIVGADGTQPLQTTGLCDPRFGYFVLSNTRIRNLGYGRHFSELKECTFFLPDCLQEQRKIATILDAWDRALEKLHALLTAKTKRLRSLRQQLLSGTRRFPEFKGERWRTLPLGEVLAHEPRITTKPKGAFLAAGIRSHGKGVFLKPDFDAEDIALDELFELRTDDLVVNITFGWEGAAAIVPPEANGALVSHRFPTFTFKTGVSFPGYFRYVIRQKRFVYEMGLASPGGAGRNRVLSKKEFLRIPVKLPSLPEQRRIAAMLDACDRETELLRRQLAALQRQKRGLMQKLLTGEVRVKPKEHQ